VGEVRKEQRMLRERIGGCGGRCMGRGVRGEREKRREREREREREKEKERERERGSHTQTHSISKISPEIYVENRGRPMGLM